MRTRRGRRRSWLPAVTCLALALPATLGASAAAATPDAPAAARRAAWPAVAAASAPTTTSTWSPYPEDTVLAFVAAVYRDLFGREPDPQGRATWAGLLLTGTPYGEVANGITYSDEYRTRLIRGTYEHYLGRGPDREGLAFWLHRMRDGQHIEDIQAGFIASDEFWARYGATPSGWVTGLYGTVLGRTPAAEEVRWWVAQMSAGMGRGDVARGFLYSTEHLTTVVDGYYVDLLGRHIDPSGKATWVGLIQAGHRDEEIIAAIVSSAEYRARNVPVPPPPDTFLVGPTGIPSNVSNWTLSHDGRWVVFDTSAEELLGPNPGYRTEVYMWDRTSGALTRLSQAPDGTAPNGRSEHPSISADGRWVTFISDASNLVSGDTNGGQDIFVWDRTTGALSLLALSGPGAGAYYFDASISADGRWITYVRSVSAAEVYVADRLDGTTRAVSAAAGGAAVNGNAFGPAISGDGRWITFTTMAMTSDEDRPYDTKVFLWDRETGTTTLVPTSADDAPLEVSGDPVISTDGRWISYAAGPAFEDTHVDLVDRTTGVRTSVPTPDPVGRWEGNRLKMPSLSADGRWVAFISGLELGVLDRSSGATSLAPDDLEPYSFGPFFQHPVISGDGQWILFQSSHPDLVEGDTNDAMDLFVTRNPLTQP